MTSTILYPTTLDNDENLYQVHDFLRVRLAEDYNIGDTVITINGDNTNFPLTGILTLTDQCSDIDDRAISFYYGLKTSTTFEDLELLPGFTDVIKLKRITNVVENVMANHHNNIKDAIIAIEEFVGVKGTTDLTPLGDTMEGRTNYLQNLVLRPRAWFTSDKKVGVVPLEVTFTDLSFRTPTYWRWCFGDNDNISVSSNVPSISVDVPSGISCVVDLNGATVKKTYYKPGYYDVILTVSNAFGSDELIIENMINARAEAPNEATLAFIDYTTSQKFTEDLGMLTGGVLKSKTDTLINIEVTDNGEQATDSITQYIWKLGDQLEHANASKTKALYDIGGLYDVKLRTNTEFGSYRTTVVNNAIDIIENRNLWLSLFQTATYAATKQATTYEFGLLSESFKITNRSSSPLITRDYSFLDGVDNENQQKREFLRNNGFTAKNSTTSGDRGTSVMYWASGYDPDIESWSDQIISFIEYEGFSDCYTTSPLTSSCNATLSSEISRPWNWIGLNSTQNIYILLGNSTTEPTTTSPTNQTKTTVSLSTQTASNVTLSTSNYKNGASELMDNVDDGSNGHFSVYRSTWLNSTGYIMRNDANGTYFRLKSFYKTEGILSDLVQNIRKLNDIPGTAKLEGQIVSLVSGVYMFNNTGEVVAYNPTSSTWAIGGPGVNSLSFKALQDTTISAYNDLLISGEDATSYDDESQRLIATSDGERRAYISFDYSEKAFIKFNEITKSFTSLVTRPIGEQWLIGTY